MKKRRSLRMYIARLVPERPLTPTSYTPARVRELMRGAYRLGLSNGRRGERSRIAYFTELTTRELEELGKRK